MFIDMTLLLLAVLSLFSCRAEAPAADVFYLVSTDVVSARSEAGDTLWRATLDGADRAAMDREVAWVEKNMFCDGFNVVAPHYHQLTFEAMTALSEDAFRAVYDSVAVEVCALFEEFMARRDRSRPFILAGFSQGAMLLLDVLRHMTDEQFGDMAVCYALGYRLSPEDLAHPHIRPASDATGRGVVVSFNSVLSSGGVWPAVSGGACTCINPVNWRTDSAEAEFEYRGMRQRVHVDTSLNVLIVESDNADYYREWMDRNGVYVAAGVPRDNLHHWDLQFYARYIHDNALERSGQFRHFAAEQQFRPGADYAENVVARRCAAMQFLPKFVGSHL